MNNAEPTDKADELDRLLNDPEIALDPGRIWQLAADLSGPARPALHGRPVDRPAAD
jgi:hypothetical protein